MWIDWKWKTIKRGPYFYGKCPEHPYANKHGYVLEHRLVAENKIKRLLDRKEEVHHINKDRYDNRPENLEVLTGTKHREIHAEETRVSKIPLVCKNCERDFEVKPNWYRDRIKKGRINFFCSRSCNAKYYKLGIDIKPPVYPLASNELKG